MDFNFTRRRDATDIIYQVERRWDLMSGSWTEVYSSIGDPFGSTEPSVTESLNIDLQGNPKAYFRLKITRPSIDRRPKTPTLASLSAAWLQALRDIRNLQDIRRKDCLFYVHRIVS